MLKRLLTLFRHRGEVRTALSTLSYLHSSGDDALDALGGLTDEEMTAVSSWATEEPGYTVVEVGTLFGLTARALDGQLTGGRVIAVDNFSWNPFGLPPRIHERFTRQILRGTKVELWNMPSEQFRAEALARLRHIDMIFFDADHRYESVKNELEWAKSTGIPIISGHDYGNPNPRFGVTRAVDEVFGRENVEFAGFCWRVKRPSTSKGSVPNKSGSVPVFSGACPHDSGACPHDSGACPHDSGACPHDSGACPHDSGACPHDSGACPQPGGVE